jgi:hypothetical protein
MQQLLDLRFSGIPIEEAPTAFESVFDASPFRTCVHPSLFSRRKWGRDTGWCCCSACTRLRWVIGMVITLPIMAVVALVVKFSRTHPASANPRRPARQTLCLV